MLQIKGVHDSIFYKKLLERTCLSPPGAEVGSWNVLNFFLGTLSLPILFSKAHFIALCTTFPSQALKFLAPAKASILFLKKKKKSG